MGENNLKKRGTLGNRSLKEAATKVWKIARKDVFGIRYRPKPQAPKNELELKDKRNEGKKT